MEVREKRRTKDKKEVSEYPRTSHFVPVQGRRRVRVSEIGAEDEMSEVGKTSPF